MIKWVLFCRREDTLGFLNCFIYGTSLTEINLTGFDSGLFTDSIYRPEDGKLGLKMVKSGNAGNRTLCLSHAKRALYHMSYIPYC